jgi:hypothetical protein
MQCPILMAATQAMNKAAPRINPPAHKACILVGRQRRDLFYAVVVASPPSDMVTMIPSGEEFLITSEHSLPRISIQPHNM